MGPHELIFSSNFLKTLSNGGSQGLKADGVEIIVGAAS